MMNPSLQIPDEGMTLEELSDFVGKQMKRLNLVLKSIDGLNIVDIKFELQGGAYLQFNRKGLVFFDGTKRTVYVDVNGEAVFTGVRVQAVDGAYPNVVFDGSGNIFQASKSATEYIAIDPDLTGSPTMYFKTPNVTALLSPADLLGALWLNATVGDLILQSQIGTIFMYPADFVKFEDWTKIKGSTQTLQQVIDALESQIGQKQDTITSGGSELPNNIDVTKFADGSVNNTEFQYINNLTSNAQSQLDGKASKTLPTLIAPSLLNSWVNFGSPFITASYYKDDFGNVHLEGVIKSGTTTAGTILFNLQVGCRPSADLVRTTISNNGADILSKVFIRTNGDVEIQFGGSVYFNLGDIKSFRGA